MIYTIVYDNGESYEDHRVYPILAFLSKDKAAIKLTKLNAWLEKARANRPEVDSSLSFAEYEIQDKAQRAYLDALKPPHGLACLVEAAGPFKEHAHLSLDTLPLIK